MSSNQKKIRDIQRQLKKFGENPELLQKLADLQTAKEEVHNKEILRKNSVKYHMVKFIERKKVTRMIRSIDSKIEKGEGDVNELKEKKSKLEEDLAYIMYFPMEQKYISLFPNNEEKSLDGDKKVSAASLKAREAALQARQFDIAAGRVDKVSHAMEVEYNGGVNNRKNKKGIDGEEEAEYHKYTNNLEPSNALMQYNARRYGSNEGAADGESNNNTGARRINNKPSWSDPAASTSTVAVSDNTGKVSAKTEKQNNNNKRKRVDDDKTNEKEDEEVVNEFYEKQTEKTNKKEKKSKSEAVKNNETVNEAINNNNSNSSNDLMGDSFFLEEVNPEDEAREEAIQEKISKNMKDIKQFVNQQKHLKHKRLNTTRSDFAGSNNNNSSKPHHNNNNREYGGRERGNSRESRPQSAGRGGGRGGAGRGGRGAGGSYHNNNNNNSNSNFGNYNKNTGIGVSHGSSAKQHKTFDD